MVHFTAADYMQGRRPEFAPERVYRMTLERIKLRVGKVVILEAPVARGRGGALAGVWAAAIVADLRRQDR